MKNHSQYSKLFICFLLGITLWVLAGTNEVPINAWRIFAVFIAVITSFILRPFPIGMMVLTGLVILIASGTITLEESLSGFADATVWLVIAAFLLAGAMINTGLGKRIALWLVLRLGKTIKGLAYAICGSEFLLATVMPSNTARGGGIHAPIVNSLAQSLGSHQSNKPDRAGIFLSLVGAHANLIAASMFMTGMAANPIVTKAVKDVYDIDFGWGTWALGAIVPGLVALLILPHLIAKLAPPTIKDGHLAQKEASRLLKEMGPISRNEKIMAVVLILLLLLWTTKFLHGFGTTTVAMIAVIVLLITKAQSWKDVITNEMAWDTLVWLGGLLTMANLLLKYGFIQWFVENVQASVGGVTGLAAILILGIIYFYSMYAFSMLTAHIAAMAGPFLAVCFTLNGQPYVAAAVFAYFSCLCGCTTNYSSGPIIIYFGLGYVTAPKWFSVGFAISIFHMFIWILVGLLWWKILGWW
ncbi:MAG: DASS family sodium-coupled anion symporter [Saprospiraceae bacterium]|nr:DASS family sodium-coupled anion symporter [Saprospiraceae bacterium]